MADLENAGRRGAQEPAGAELGPRYWEWWLAPVTVIAVLALWEWLARTGKIPKLFFPAPLSIAATTVRLLTTGKLLPHVAATARRVVLGMALGGLPGMALGLAMGWSRRLRVVADPFVAATHPLPKIAMLPLVMIIFGIGETALVVVVALSCFFPMLISAAAGVRQIRPIYFEAAENYGAGPLQTCAEVVVPGSLPLLLSGVRLALNSAVLLSIAVELVAAQRGLGALVWFAWQTLRTEELYVGLVVSAALGVGSNWALQWASRRLLPWQPEREVRV